MELSRADPSGMVVWYGMVWYSMVWYGVVWHRIVWSGLGLGFGVGASKGRRHQQQQQQRQLAAHFKLTLFSASTRLVSVFGSVGLFGPLVSGPLGLHFYFALSLFAFLFSLFFVSSFGSET